MHTHTHTYTHSNYELHSHTPHSQNNSFSLDEGVKLNQHFPENFALNNLLRKHMNLSGLLDNLNTYSGK